MKRAPTHSRPFLSTRGGILLAGAAIVVAAWAAYKNSFSGALVFDDLPSIAENPTIHRLWPLWLPLAPPQEVGVGGRPLLNLTYAINYAFGGTAVAGYHAVNLLIHLLAGLTLFGIVRRTLARRETSATPTTDETLARSATVAERASVSSVTAAARLSSSTSTSLAFSIALLWTLHPLQTASVTYLSQRAESLMGLFYLLTLYCFIRGGPSSLAERELRRGEFASGASRGGKFGSASFLWFALSWLACLLGMATKEVMVTAPVMVLLYDRTFIAGSFRAAWRRHRNLYLALAGTWLLLGDLWLISNPHTRGVGFGFGVSSWAYALTECGAIVRYLGLAIWPHPLVLDYDTPIVTSAMAALPSFLVLLLLLAASLFLFFGGSFRRLFGRNPGAGEKPADAGSLGEGGRALGFVGCWFFVSLAPTSSIVPVAAQAMAENRMYLPLAAVAVLAVLGIRALAGRRGWMVILCLAIAGGWLTARRNEDYRNPLAMWSETVRLRPGNPRAHYLLANLLLGSGRAPEATAHYEQAVRLNPNFPEAWNAWGFALAGAGRLEEAVQRYRQALRLKPDYPEAAYNLGNALAQTGRLPEAIAHYGTALRLRPGFWEAEENLGSALLNTGRAEEAAAHYAAALRLRPDDADLHFDLALTLRALGRLDEARVQFEAAERLGGRR